MNRVQNLSMHLVHGERVVNSVTPNSKAQQQPKANHLSYEQVTKMSLDDIRNRYGKERKDGVVLSGVNHVAFVTSDMAKTIWFWCEVLGMKLTKTLQLPGEGQHFFIDAGRGCSIAYFYFKDAPKITPGISTVDLEKLMKGEGFSTAHGSVNHMAFNVPLEKLREYRNKVKSANYGFVTPILYHSDVEESGYSPKRDENTVWESFYFVGPDGEYLEFTSQVEREFVPQRDINHIPQRLA